MEAAAIYKNARISAQKVRLVADQIRGLSVEKANHLLRFSSKKAASILKKVLDSAIANAEHNLGADIDVLKIATVYVNEGPRLKRFRARARGRANRIIKPTCHVTVIVGAQEEI